MDLDRATSRRCALLALAFVAASTRNAAQSLRLNGPLFQQRDADVTTFRITADGARVVFRANPGADERFELFAAPVAGGPPVRVNGELPPGGSVGGFGVTADRAVYLADQSEEGRVELFSVAF